MIAVVVVVVGIILTGIYIYLNDNLKTHTFQRIRSTLSKEAKLAKSHLESKFTKTMSIQDIDKIADEIGKDLDLRVTVISLDGSVLGDSEIDGESLDKIENHLYRPEVQDALNKDFGESRRFSTTVQKDMLYMAFPFSQEAILEGETQKAQGVVRLAIPLSEIEIISDNLKRLLFLSLLIAFILALIIGTFASLYVSNPIKRISSLAKDIADGDYSKRVVFSTNDEIEDLGKAINHMSEQIKARIEEVVSGKSRLEAMLLNMFEGVMVVDGDGTILLMNETLKSLFNINETPAGKKPLEVIRNIEIQEIVNRVLELKGGVESKELSILLPIEKTLQINATPIVKEEETDGAVLVFHDITELRRLENIRRDFVANVSHELKTPITNILGYSETLLDGALEDKKNAKDFVKIISSDSQRLAHLVDDLLELSRIESGRLNLNVQPLGIEGVVDRVMLALKRQLKEKGILVEKEISKEIHKVKADEDKVAQALLNLIDNAIKYNNEGGSITISAIDNGQFLEINVTDSGIGIPEEDCSRIFERFYRVDKARSRELGGTGLGLSIVKHIIQAHGGQVTVKSALEKGSTFSFTLPKA